MWEDALTFLLLLIIFTYSRFVTIMAKSTSQSQAAFSFLDEVEKAEPLPKPKRNTLKPPAQIEIVEDKAVVDPVAHQPTVAIEEDFDAGNDVNETDVIPQVEEAAVIQQEEAAEQKEIEDEDSISIDNTSGDEDADNHIEEKFRKHSRGRKSVKEHALAASHIEMPSDELLFSKHYYSMGEVTAMFRENHSLIRYWESEFDILKPKKNGKGDRFFRPVDVKNLFLIYDLLRRRKFTIEGAKEYLKNNKKADEKFAAVQSLEKIKSFFLELKATL